MWAALNENMMIGCVSTSYIHYRKNPYFIFVPNFNALPIVCNRVHNDFLYGVDYSAPSALEFCMYLPVQG